MKILLLADGMESGGAETHVATLARGLLRAGHCVGLCSRGGKMAESLAREGVHCRELPEIGRNPLAFLAAKRILAGEVKKHGYEILHSHTRMTALLAKQICNPYMQKSGFSSLGGATCPCNPDLRKTAKMPARVVTAHARFRADGIYRLLSDWGDAAIAVSEDLRAYVADSYGLPAACVTVIPNGIDTDRFCPAPERLGGKGVTVGNMAETAVLGVKGAMVENMVEKGETAEILFVSRLEPDCSLGARLLFEAAPLLLRDRQLPPFRITVAGRGSERGALTALAGRLNLLVGRPLAQLFAPQDEDELIALYRRASVFVGVSRAAMEASFCGAPVLLCGNEGYGGPLSPDRADLAAGNFCCRGLPLPTANALARDLAVLLKNQAPCYANAQKTSAWLRETFPAQKAVRATEAVYRRLLWRRGKGEFPT